MLCFVLFGIAILRVAGSVFLPSVPPMPYQSGPVEDVVIRVTSGNDRQELVLKNGALVFAPAHPTVSYGDQLRIFCKLERPEPFEGFAYDRFLAAKGIYWICFSRQAPVILARDQGGWLMGLLQGWRRGIQERIDSVFGEPHASLLAGLLFGEKRFSDVWEDRFIETGTSHIVAASGYNVALVASLCAFGLASFGIGRARAFTLIISAIVGYMLFAGLETAVVRAGIMGILVVLARNLGRATTMTNTLLLTAAGMLTVNPLLLIDDAAFTLSFLSTIGLIYIAPTWQRSWTWIPDTWGLREVCTSTIAATFMSLPVLLFQFEHIALMSLVTNVFILPLIPLIMCFGALSILVAPISMALAEVVSLPAEAGMNWMFLMVAWSSSLPLYLSVSSFAAVSVFILWGILLLTIWKRHSFFSEFVQGFFSYCSRSALGLFMVEHRGRRGV